MSSFLSPFVVSFFSGVESNNEPLQLNRQHTRHTAHRFPRALSIHRLGFNPLPSWLSGKKTPTPPTQPNHLSPQIKKTLHTTPPNPQIPSSPSMPHRITHIPDRLLHHSCSSFRSDATNAPPRAPPPNAAAGVGPISRFTRQRNKAFPRALLRSASNSRGSKPCRAAISPACGLWGECVGLWCDDAMPFGPPARQPTIHRYICTNETRSTRALYLEGEVLADLLDLGVQQVEELRPRRQVGQGVDRVLALQVPGWTVLGVLVLCCGVRSCFVDECARASGAWMGGGFVIGIRFCVVLRWGVSNVFIWTDGDGRRDDPT